MIIRKIVAPSNLQQEDQNTVWIADLESGQEIWIQTSEDKEKTKWMRLGDIYEEVWFKLPNDAMNTSVVNLIMKLRTMKDEQSPT